MKPLLRWEPLDDGDDDLHMPARDTPHGVRQHFDLWAFYAIDAVGSLLTHAGVWLVEAAQARRDLVDFEWIPEHGRRDGGEE